MHTTTGWYHYEPSQPLSREQLCEHSVVRPFAGLDPTGRNLRPRSGQNVLRAGYGKTKAQDPWGHYNEFLAFPLLLAEQQLAKRLPPKHYPQAWVAGSASEVLEVDPWVSLLELLSEQPSCQQSFWQFARSGVSIPIRWWIECNMYMYLSSIPTPLLIVDTEYMQTAYTLAYVCMN